MKVLLGKAVFTGEKTIENGAVAFGDKIAAVGTKEEVLSKAPGAEVIDVTDSVIIPGLVNSHIHFEIRQVFGTLRGNLTLTTTDLALRASRSALCSLRDGVTAARDMGHKNNVQWDLKKAVENKTVLGPKIRASRGAIVMNYGHGHVSGWNVANLDEALANIRQQASEGAEFIKILASHDDLPNVKHPDLCVPWWSQEELNAVAELAHRCGIKITAHGCGHETIRMLIKAGFDCIEHGFGITDEDAAEMAQRGMFFCPTLTAMKQNSDYSWKREKLMHERCAFQWGKQQEYIKAAVRHKVKMTCGTDNMGNMAEEICLLVDAGLTPAEALACATKNGAELLEFYDTGVLEEGKCADIAVVKGNPLKDPRDMRNVETVVIDGAMYSTDLIRQVIPASPLFHDDPNRFDYKTI